MNSPDILALFRASCDRVDRGDGYQAPLERLAEADAAQILHASLGISTEAGEIADIVKRSLFYGTPVDVPHAIEEAGDLLWYLDRWLKLMGSSIGEAMAVNIEKLNVRYKQGFNETDAVERDLEAEEKARTSC